MESFFQAHYYSGVSYIRLISLIVAEETRLFCAIE